MTRTTTYPFTFSMLERNAYGHWTAALTIYGQTHAVDRSQGSWRYTPVDAGCWQELEPVYCAALQESVRKVERAERRVTA